MARWVLECLGSATFAHCPFPGLDEPLTCQFEGRNGSDRIRAGSQLALHIPPEAAYLFDAQGRAMRRLCAPSCRRESAARATAPWWRWVGPGSVAGSGADTAQAAGSGSTATRATNGLQKVGDAFTAESGVPVVVQHPRVLSRQVPGRRSGGQGPGHHVLGARPRWANGRAPAFWCRCIRPSACARPSTNPAWRAFTYQGKVWGYPWPSGGGPDRQPRPGTPHSATFDEVIALDKELSKRGKKAIPVGLQQVVLQLAAAGRAGWRGIRPQRPG